MELAAIITTLVVVVLQIITVALVVKTRKMVAELSKIKANSSFSNEKQDRRDRDFRQNKRPGQDNRRPQAQVTGGNAAVDPVEKSLRDINLKLKNAERDQEFARRKFHDNMSKDHQGRRRDNNDRRGNRDHQNRGDRRGNNWQDRNNKRDSSHPAEVSNEEVRAFEPVVAPVISPENEQAIIEPQAVEPVSTAQDTMVPRDFGSDDLQHGRKFMVKRRVLKEGEEDDGSIGNESSTEIGSIQNESSQDRIENENESPEATEIRFGRR